MLKTLSFFDALVGYYDYYELSILSLTCKDLNKTVNKYLNRSDLITGLTKTKATITERNRFEYPCTYIDAKTYAIDFGETKDCYINNLQILAKDVEKITLITPNITITLTKDTIKLLKCIYNTEYIPFLCMLNHNKLDIYKCKIIITCKKYPNLSFNKYTVPSLFIINKPKLRLSYQGDNWLPEDRNNYSVKHFGFNNTIDYLIIETIKKLNKVSILINDDELFEYDLSDVIKLGYYYVIKIDKYANNIEIIFNYKKVLPLDEYPPLRFLLEHYFIEH